MAAAIGFGLTNKFEQKQPQGLFEQLYICNCECVRTSLPDFFVDGSENFTPVTH